MGGDGGSIARRSELVRSKKKPEKVARDVQDAARWKYCALSQEPLRQPIVTCPLGRLYNKEAVIRALIDKTISENENARHILSLKDIKELNLTKNPDFEKLEKIDKSDIYKDLNMAEFICPVVGLEMNGKYRFCAVWSCGCVFSERALKELKLDVCQKCGKHLNADDIIVLYGTDEEISEYSKKLNEKREKQKIEKLQKKSQKDDNKLSDKKKKNLKRKLEPDAKKDEKSVSNSVQDDKTKSHVFKSLFTTSDCAKNQPKSHWVTYNPLYY